MIRDDAMMGAIFGSDSAARVLLYLEAYGEGYGREIARTFEMPQSLVQRQLRKLEAAGLLVARDRGRIRIYQWDPRSRLVPALRELLRTGLQNLPEREREAYFRQRRRPRRSGKPL